jgi:hypothetical protein
MEFEKQGRFINENYEYAFLFDSFLKLVDAAVCLRDKVRFNSGIILVAILQK